MSTFSKDSLLVLGSLFSDGWNDSTCKEDVISVAIILIQFETHLLSELNVLFMQLIIMFTIIKELLLEALPKNLYRVYVFLVIVQKQYNIWIWFIKS